MRRIPIAALVAALSACGGGGGDDGGPKVSLVVTSPTSISADVYESQRLPDLHMSIRVSGDPSALTGKTVYLVLSMQHVFLFGAPSISMDPDGLGVGLYLQGQIPPDGVTTYAGTLHVRACLDPACKSELPVSNADIPYTLHVKKGLTVGMAIVALDTTFGTMPAAVTVPVGLPDGATSWSVKPPWGSSTFGSLRADKALDGTNNVVCSSVELRLPGLVQQGAVLEAVTAEGLTLSRTFQLSSQTSSSAVAWAFQRPSVLFEVTQGYPNLSPSVFAGALFPGSDSDRFHYVGTTYSWPPAADADPYRDHWLYAYRPDEISLPRLATQQYMAELQIQACFTGDCLPPGVYGALVHYQYAPAGGAVEDAYQTIEMNVVP